MPKVNVKYKLEFDAVITDLHHLRFEDKEINKRNDETSPTLFDGKVKNISVDNKIYIDVMFGGFGGTWSLEVSVIKLDQSGKEKGDGVKLKTFPIKGDLENGNQRRGRYEIAW